MSEWARDKAATGASVLTRPELRDIHMGEEIIIYRDSVSWRKNLC
jgi:hypothetical protein